MIRKAGQRLLQSLVSKDRGAQRIQNAQRYKNRPGDLPSRVGVPHVGVNPMNEALFKGDGYSAL